MPNPTSDSLKDSLGRPMRYYTIVRIVKETFSILAIDKDDAMARVDDPVRVEVIKETIKIQK